VESVDQVDRKKIEVLSADKMQLGQLFSARMAALSTGIDRLTEG